MFFKLMSCQCCDPCNFPKQILLIRWQLYSLFMGAYCFLEWSFLLFSDDFPLCFCGQNQVIFYFLTQISIAANVGVHGLYSIGFKHWLMTLGFLLDCYLGTPPNKSFIWMPGHLPFSVWIDVIDNDCLNLSFICFSNTNIFKPLLGCTFFGSD